MSPIFDDGLAVLNTNTIVVDHAVPDGMPWRGRSVFVEWPHIDDAKIAIVDLMLAGLVFDVVGFFLNGTEESNYPEVHFTISAWVGDETETAFIAYVESLGGTYSGS